MREPDSYIIDIKDDENTAPITRNIVTGISNAEIISRYRDYESRYTNNPNFGNGKDNKPLQMVMSNLVFARAEDYTMTKPRIMKSFVL
jgi:hypothetical protein